MTTSKRIYKVTGQAWGLLVEAARKESPNNADEQRAFLEDCIAQLNDDLRNA